MTLAAGTSSCSNSSRFGATSTLIMVVPVALPPGRLRLVTSPARIGSAAVAKTMGMVVVAVFAASAAGVVVAANQGHLTMNQVGRQCGQSFVLIPGEAIFDRDVLTLDKACAFSDLDRTRPAVAGRRRAPGR